MPLPTEALDAQQALILAQMDVIYPLAGLRFYHWSIWADDPENETLIANLAAADAALQVERREVAAMVGDLALILLQDPNYQPPTEAARIYDFAYQVALALAPSSLAELPVYLTALVTDPTSGSPTIPDTGSPKVTFSVAMDPATCTTSTIKIQRQDTLAFIPLDSIAMSAGDTIATIDPTSTLPTSVDLKVIVTTDVMGADGETLAAQYESFVFTAFTD